MLILAVSKQSVHIICDARDLDLKSSGPKGRAGSSPALGMQNQWTYRFGQSLLYPRTVRSKMASTIYKRGDPPNVLIDLGVDSNARVACPCEFFSAVGQLEAWSLPGRIQTNQHTRSL